MFGENGPGIPSPAYRRDTEVAGMREGELAVVSFAPAIDVGSDRFPPPPFIRGLRMASALCRLQSRVPSGSGFEFGGPRDAMDMGNPVPMLTARFGLP